jgi:hypothetical protein
MFSMPKAIEDHHSSQAIRPAEAPTLQDVTPAGVLDECK